MPVENAYSFSGGSLFESNYDDHANTTWHALNNTAFEHSWSCEEATYLLDNPDLTCDSPHIDLLKILKTRPLGNYYADALKQFLAEESALSVVDDDVCILSERDIAEIDLTRNKTPVPPVNSPLQGLSPLNDMTVAECAIVDEPAAKKMFHKMRNREPSILSAEINKAQELALGADVNSIWGELTKLAEKSYGIMIGFSSDGIQYRGSQHQASGVHDVFTKKNLRQRLERKKR